MATIDWFVMTGRKLVELEKERFECIRLDKEYTARWHKHLNSDPEYIDTYWTDRSTEELNRRLELEDKISHLRNLLHRTPLDNPVKPSLFQRFRGLLCYI